ncbi:MAG: signal peptide peptidase SppA [Armatimonadetes bacterium]|nr:signal peptide peptidase SppA [Armatimonadota bacterium]
MMSEEFTNNTNPEPERPTPPPPPIPPQGAYYQVPQYAPPPPRPPRNNTWMIPVSLVIGCLPWVILGLMLMVAIIGSIVSSGVSGEHVALLHVSGVITGGKSSSSMFGDSVVGSEDLVAQLESLRKKSGVKVIVLRINSPGGSASGSEEVYNEIVRVRKAGKLVYASMGDLAASGGYYIASACDKIYANSSTMTGSIGVIFPLADLSDLYKKIGYKSVIVKAGKYKDIGSSDRPLTSEERAMLQALVNETYSGFLNAVADGRKMPLSRVKQLAEGRIYTGTQALKVNLIDNIGGLHETIAAAAKAAGIKGEPKVQEYGKKGFIELLSGGSESASDRLSDVAQRELIKKLLQRAGEVESLK